MSLNDFFIEKAEKELRETDARKNQSLVQFRNWLSNHPFLKDVRQGEKSYFRN